MHHDEDLDYVQGSRWLTDGKRENMTFSRTILTWLYSLLFRLLFRKKITDATNGFRVFRKEVLDNPKLNLWQNKNNFYFFLFFYKCYPALSGSFLLDNLLHKNI